MTLRLNDKYLGGFVSEAELLAIQPEVTKAYETLTGKSGEGNDYLGWIDLPVNYDREEAARIVKAADKIAAYIKCVEETRIGNKEFAKAKQTLKREIDSYRKHEEVEWFCVTYLESFSLTLDELE